VLIETILAAFEMDEILYELSEHSAGLNCGCRNYIFSAIKKFNAIPAFVLPDRDQLTMCSHFMRSCSLLTIKTCHRRNAPAIGGMSAYIPPIKNDSNANEEALACIRADKRREVTDGYDGTWIAHPGLVPVAREEFAVMKSPNQIGRKREDVHVTATDLLRFPEGTITEVGLCNNISVSLQYLESWLRGTGCMPINGVMEDVASVEIARAQIWQWIHHPWGILDDDRKVTIALFRRLMSEERAKIKHAIGEPHYVKGRFEQAAEILDQLITSEQFVDFLTLPAYCYLD
jgi:malate synthase